MNLRNRSDWPQRQIGLIAICVAVNACITSAISTTMPVILTLQFHRSYLSASAFMVASALASSIAVYVMGRLADVPSGRHIAALISAICGLSGSLLLTITAGYWAYLIIFSTLLAVAATLFPQLMALAFVKDSRSSSLLRAIASGGWVIGPPIAGFIATGSSAAALFWLIAAGYGSVIVALAIVSKEPTSPNESGRSCRSSPSSHPPKVGSLPVTIAILSAIHFLIAICALGIPWRIVDLGGDQSHVGLAFSIAAMTEIPFILLAPRLRNRFGHSRLLLGALMMLTAYFGLASVSRLAGMIVVSFFNGIATGLMMGLSLMILQDRMADRPGHATSIYSNIIRLSYLAALATAGTVAQELSVGAIFWVAGVIAFCLCCALPILQRLSTPANKSYDGER